MTHINQVSSMEFIALADGKTSSQNRAMRLKQKSDDSLRHIVFTVASLKIKR